LTPATPLSVTDPTDMRVHYSGYFLNLLAAIELFRETTTLQPNDFEAQLDRAPATPYPTPSDFWRRFPSAFSSSAVPERHRHHDSTERQTLFTVTLESCSRSGGIRVHDAVETVITMSRNMHP
jgi:hypothetical protein